MLVAFCGSLCVRVDVKQQIDSQIDKKIGSEKKDKEIRRLENDTRKKDREDTRIRDTGEDMAKTTVLTARTFHQKQSQTVVFRQEKMKSTGNEEAQTACNAGNSTEEQRQTERQTDREKREELVLSTYTGLRTFLLRRDLTFCAEAPILLWALARFSCSMASISLSSPTCASTQSLGTSAAVLACPSFLL